MLCNDHQMHYHYDSTQQTNYTWHRKNLVRYRYTRLFEENQSKLGKSSELSLSLYIYLEQELQSLGLSEKWSQDGGHWRWIALKVVNSFFTPFSPLLAKMAEIEELYRTSVPVLSIVFVCAVNTKLASLCGLELSLQISMELTMQDIHDTEWMLN